jgi:hypothetical protein
MIFFSKFQIQNFKKKLKLNLKLKFFFFLSQMGCPALGIWVAFLKQPDALPGRAPQKIKLIYF